MKQLAAGGFDAVRLLVHWAEIEPQPGQFSELYFSRINQILNWANSYQVAVVIDFHQDNFANISHFCCADDGAPGWAWLVNETLAELTTMQKEEIKVLAKEIKGLDWEGAMIAFYAFWHNSAVPSTGKGLQQHYIEAVGMMVNRTMDHPALIGWEIMNEPLPGEWARPLRAAVDPDLYLYRLVSSTLCTWTGTQPPGLDIQLVGFSTDYLYPFYALTIQALTGVRDGKPTCPSTSPVSLDSQCAYPDLGECGGYGCSN
jgi:hypothetical protein